MVSPSHPVLHAPRAAALGLLACAVLAWPVHAAEEAEAGRAGAAALSVSPDGTLVVDARARLAWARCVEGMHWDGSTCAGSPRLLGLTEAKALAKQRWQAEGVRWRLPRVNELRRLVNRKALPPSVDTQLFPAMPRDWLWTGTASVNTNTVNPYAYGNVARGGAGESSMTVQQSWAVDMASGEARGDVGRATRLHVQLVRPAP